MSESSNSTPSAAPSLSAAAQSNGQTSEVIPIDDRLARRSPQITALVADGHGLMRAGLRRLLEDQRDIAVTGEAANGEQVLALVQRLEPDVVVIDVDLPGIDGFEVTRQLLSQSPPDAIRVVLLIGADSDDGMLAALEAGASGVLVKDSDAPELLHAVRVVAAGGATLGPDVTHRVIGHVLSHSPGRGRVPAELSELTPREREVMGLVAMGLSNDEIAERLVVTPATAKTHVSRARRKIGARDRAQLVVYAYETGLVAPRPVAPESPDAAGFGLNGHGQWPPPARHGLLRAS